MSSGGPHCLDSENDPLSYLKDPATPHQDLKSGSGNIFSYQIQCSSCATSCSKLFMHFNSLKTHCNPRNGTVLLGPFCLHFTFEEVKAEGWGTYLLSQARTWHRLPLCYDASSDWWLGGHTRRENFWPSCSPYWEIAPCFHASLASPRVGSLDTSRPEWKIFTN